MTGLGAIGLRILIDDGRRPAGPGRVSVGGLDDEDVDAWIMVTCWGAGTVSCCCCWLITGLVVMSFCCRDIMLVLPICSLKPGVCIFCWRLFMVPAGMSCTEPAPVPAAITTFCMN
uniref:(northern house mosquito) hypothetical protein n=1 Tax=Culex pipiens TaxID=7175 RepID=A0A8D8KXZ8_CULPI